MWKEEFNALMKSISCNSTVPASPFDQRSALPASKLSVRHSASKRYAFGFGALKLFFAVVFFFQGIIALSNQIDMLDW